MVSNKPHKLVLLNVLELKLAVAALFPFEGPNGTGWEYYHIVSKQLFF